MHTHLRFCRRAVALTALFTFVSTLAYSDSRDDVLDRGDVLRKTGKTLYEWGTDWWQWAFKNPQVLGDTTGEFGPLGNARGPVFFAEGSAGGTVNLSYTVPTGKYILLPVSVYVWTFFDPCAHLRCATKIINQNFVNDITGVFATIDGVRVRNINSFDVRVGPNDPVFLVDAGPIGPDGYGGILPAVQGGYWLMLEPLSPGRHNISFGATVPNLDPITGELLAGTTQLVAHLRLEARNH